MPTIERLRELLSYDQETGKFVWRINVGRGKAGAIAGPLPDWHGYLMLRVDGRLYSQHQLAWYYVHSEWPARLDHINGSGTDNRIANLRIASQSQNIANSRAYSGKLKGVSLDKRRGKWKASICKDGNAHWLGYFNTAQEAHIAYMAKARELFGEFARAK